MAIFMLLNEPTSNNTVFVYRFTGLNPPSADFTNTETVLRHILQTKASPSMARILAGEALEIKASAGGTLKSVNYLN